LELFNYGSVADCITCSISLAPPKADRDISG
jgi:hypothetical protein